MRGLLEKALLRRLASRHLPESVWRRPKRPYRAPIHAAFLGKDAPLYVDRLLSPEAIKAAGWFKPAAVAQLLGKLRAAERATEADEMALCGVLSAQIVQERFFQRFEARGELSARDRFKVCSPDKTKSNRTSTSILFA